MRQFLLTVAEIATSSGQVHVRCSREPAGTTAPGQFHLVRVEGSPQSFVRLPIFPYPGPRDELEFSIDQASPLASLEPGMLLDLIGPCGRGFVFHPRAAHLLLIAASVERLLPLMHFALASRRAVTLLLSSASPLPEVPSDVEIQRGPLTADLATWADLIALDVPDPAPCAREARAMCPARPADFVQALITPPMPCGAGACLACWLERDGRRRLACVDGPVFSV